jgi:chaperonin GroEL (HSP60 family)
MKLEPFADRLIALQNTASTARSILTTEAIVAEVPKGSRRRRRWHA